MTSRDIEGKINTYEAFIEEKLKDDLRLANDAVNRLQEEKQHWMDAKLNFRMMKTFREQCPDQGMDIELPLAEWESRRIIASAHIPYLNAVNVTLGCGVSLGMELEEADKYADVRLKAIARQINHYMELAAQIKVHIKVTLLAIDELMSTTGNIDKEKCAE